MSQEQPAQRPKPPQPRAPTLFVQKKKRNPYAALPPVTGSGSGSGLASTPGQQGQPGQPGQTGQAGQAGQAPSNSNARMEEQRGRLGVLKDPSTVARSSTPLSRPIRSTPNTPSRSGTPSQAQAQTQSQPQQTAARTFQDYPIHLLPRIHSLNPASLTDPVLASLPFPTSLNIIHLKHPTSTTQALPDLSNPPGPIYLNRKDPSAPPPPPPEVVQQRMEERARIAASKIPEQQPDGTWRVREWDYKRMDVRKLETGETYWKEARDPSLVAPDLGGGGEVKRKSFKKGKKRFGKGPGGSGGGAGGGAGGSNKTPQGEPKMNVKMREQAIMYRLMGQRNDLPSETDSSSSSDHDNPDESNGGAHHHHHHEDPAGNGKKKGKGKMYRRAAVLANQRNREKLPFILEGEFAGDNDPSVPDPSAGTGSAGKLKPSSTGEEIPEEIQPVDLAGTKSKSTRYVSNGVSDVNDHYVAILFKSTRVGLRWVGREYTFGNRVLDGIRNETEGMGQGYGQGGRWGGRGGRQMGHTPSHTHAQGSHRQAQATPVQPTAVDMELYRPATPITSIPVDTKPNLSTGPNPNAFPRILAQPPASTGRGRNAEPKPLPSTRTLASKLAKFEQSEYTYARAGSGRDVDEDAVDEIQRGRARGRARMKWEDEEAEMRGRKGGVGRGDVERGAGEDWDVEYTGEQDDEEEVLVNAEEEEFARERDARIKEEYDLANANVGLLQRDEAEESDDSDDLFGDKLTAKQKAKKREKKLRRKLAGANSEDELSDSEDESSSDESSTISSDEEKDVKPDVAALAAATAATPKETTRKRTASPTGSARKAGSPAPVKREASPTGTVRALSVDRGAGHALAARRALSPAVARSSLEPGSRGKKRKGPPVQNTAPPESGGSSRLSTPVSKKVRANTEGPSPTGSPASSPASTDVNMEDVDPPVVTGTGGMASAATGHTPDLKKHKSRGKKNKNPAVPGEPSSSAGTPARMSSPAPSRHASPAPGSSGRTSSVGPKKDQTPPRDTPAEKARLRASPYPGALTARMIRDVLSRHGPMRGVDLFNEVKKNETPSMTPEQIKMNRTRIREICALFCTKRKAEGGDVFVLKEGEQFD